MNHNSRARLMILETEGEMKLEVLDKQSETLANLKLDAMSYGDDVKFS